MGSGEGDVRRLTPQAKTDGPYVHRYKTYTGTTFYIFNVKSTDGVRHVFHVPEELYDVIEQSVIYGVDKR